MEPEAISELKKQLDPAHIKQRKGAGNKQLSYLEGWLVISEANRIFGYDGWSSETQRLEHVGTVELPPDDNGKIRKHVAYRSTVQVTIGGVTRQGSGYGDGIEANELKAHELAIKESETDARKRAFMTFGNPFGLALYDKERNGVAEPTSPKTEFFKQITDTIEAAKDGAALGAWWNSETQKAARKDFGMSQTEADHYKKQVTDKINQLKRKAA